MAWGTASEDQRTDHHWQLLAWFNSIKVPIITVVFNRIGEDITRYFSSTNYLSSTDLHSGFIKCSFFIPYKCQWFRQKILIYQNRAKYFVYLITKWYIIISFFINNWYILFERNFLHYKYTRILLADKCYRFDNRE